MRRVNLFLLPLTMALLGSTGAHSAVVQPAKRIAQQGVVNDDYPAEALRLHQQGDVEIQFEISEEGRVENCSVLKTSGSQSLDGVTCGIFAKMARYRAARDEAGQRVRSSDTSVIKWRLPRSAR